MRSNTSLLGRVLLWIALQARNINENLKKIFNENLSEKCATVRCFWGGFILGSPYGSKS